tara:strand:- start:402 stop:938 length:537 start_codon:yes stop_codon:yes gene_type:complete
LVVETLVLALVLSTGSSVGSYLHFIVDVQTWVAYELRAYREQAVASKKFDTTLLICNCGEFHGLLDKNGLVEVLMMLGVMEWKEGLSLCSLFEGLLYGATAIELSLLNGLILASLLCVNVGQTEITLLMTTSVTGITCFVYTTFTSTRATKNGTLTIQNDDNTGRAFNVLAEALTKQT